MKVYIGPYRNWFGPYQLAEFLCFWAKDQKDEYGFPRKPDWVHNFGEWLAYGNVITKPEKGEPRKLKLDDDRGVTLLYKFLTWIDSKKKRKVDIRIDPWDTWNMAETLGDIILPMLKQLRETKHGSPSGMSAFGEESNVHWPQMCFDFYKEDDKLANEKGHEQWVEILNKMIWAFEQVVDTDRDSKFHTGNHDIYLDPIKNDEDKIISYEMKQGPEDTSKFDAKAYREYYDKINEGLALFGKYYMNLWD